MAFFSRNLAMSSLLAELLERFEKEGRPNLHENISILWICYEGQNPKANSGIGAAWLENKLFYPASVVKLIYACAIEAWLEKDLLIDSLEMRRALKDMISNSSNDATSFILDLLTGTSSGPSLKGESWTIWKRQRELVNNWLRAFNFTEFEAINCVQKTWTDGPFGRDKEFYGERNENRNSLTTSAVARIMESIMTNSLLNSQSNRRLQELFKRSLDPLKRKSDPENQVDGFLGEGLPQGSLLWSKAGLMSEVRHDAAWFIPPRGTPMLLIVFCNGKKLAKDNFLLPALSSELVKWKSDQ